MDKIIMPELISPTFAEVIASNPEVLKIIVAHQPGEEVIVGQNCTLDCNSNPTNVKLVFCNVTIGMNDTADESNKGCSAGETEKQIGNCHMKISGRDHEQEGLHWGEAASKMSQLKLEVAALGARMEEIEKILKLIPRQICNRKLVARCKRDMNEAAEQLVAKKKELDYKDWLTDFWE